MSSSSWKQDVFVSSSTRDKNFISILSERLHQLGIGHFRDDKKDEAGKNKQAKCLSASGQKFAFALVMLSNRYVESMRCLNELAEILKCDDIVVIPIFYMKREEILHSARTGKLHEHHIGALVKAEKIRGCELKAANGSENLIDEIVGRLVNEIRSRYSGKYFTFGPFGGKGQNERQCFDEVELEKIPQKGIEVTYGNFIKSVEFTVPGDTPTEPKNEGKGNFQVKLKDGEYLTSFAGSTNANEKGKIESLTFRTNKRILGPIGKEKEGEKKKEEYFSVPLDARKITHFFRRLEDNSLASVGARVELLPKNFNPFQSVGLFGRECGKEWDDKREHADVRKIVIRTDKKKEKKSDSSQGTFIRFIEFTYINKDKTKKPLEETKKHGSESGLNMTTDLVTIHLKEGEYLTSISGYYTDDICGDDKDFGITSLTFRTNRQMAKPTGEEKGIYFSSPATASRIVGFYGWTDKHLCGIGAYFEPVSDHGPSRDYRNVDDLRQIYLPYGHHISSLRFVYGDGSEKGWIDEHPGKASPHNMANLDYPQEYLTSISGYMGASSSISPTSPPISSITFYSNKRRFVFGDETKGEEYFWYPSIGSRIIGFYVSRSLDHIEVQVEPIPHLYPFKTVRPPMKGSGGDPWDDGVHTDVRGFRVTVDDLGRSRVIKSITTWYDNNGSLVKGHQHGGQDASTENTVMVMLDFPKERLLKITGYMGTAGVETIIQNLRIFSTRDTYGPFAPRKNKGKGKGKTVPEEFVIPEEDKPGRIIGLFGMAGKSRLNSIGVRLEPC